MTHRRPRILVVDDKPNMVGLIRRLLEGKHEILEALDGTQAAGVLAREEVDCIISDIVMPGLDGMELLMRARSTRPGVQVILMTGFGTVEQAVLAVKSGAFDYVTKPFDPDELVETVKRALDGQDRFASRGPLPGVIGVSEAMQRVFSQVQSVRSSEATVLLLGESGTGKGLIARAIHSLGRRQDGRFVHVNCGAIPRELLESELMGFSQGAFSGAVAPKKGLIEEAEGGTLFLDEISEMPLELQIKMNTLLQDREVRRLGEVVARKFDVRFIAATHRDLAQLIGEGRFREDLYYRVNVFPIVIPPLRERREDILPLARHGLIRAASREGKSIQEIPPEIEGALAAHDWPGNVRELENLIERAVILARSDRLSREDFPGILFEKEPLPVVDPADLEKLTYRQVMEVTSQLTTRVYLERLMKLYHGNVTRAAAHAGIERQSLHRLMRRYGVRSRPPPE